MSPEKATHDYQRNGTTPLFAALEVATGKVTDQGYDRHGKVEFLDFLKKGAKAYPRELHVVLNNYHTHKHDEINAWLDSRRNPAPRRSDRQVSLAGPGGRAKGDLTFPV